MNPQVFKRKRFVPALLGGVGLFIIAVGLPGFNHPEGKLVVAAGAAWTLFFLWGFERPKLVLYSDRLLYRRWGFRFKTIEFRDVRSIVIKPEIGGKPMNWVVTMNDGQRRFIGGMFYFPEEAWDRILAAIKKARPDLFDKKARQGLAPAKGPDVPPDGLTFRSLRTGTGFVWSVLLLVGLLVVIAALWGNSIVLGAVGGLGILVVLLVWGLIMATHGLFRYTVHITPTHFSLRRGSTTHIHPWRELHFAWDSPSTLAGSPGEPETWIAAVDGDMERAYRFDLDAFRPEDARTLFAIMRERCKPDAELRRQAFE